MFKQFDKDTVRSVTKQQCKQPTITVSLGKTFSNMKPRKAYGWVFVYSLTHNVKPDMLNYSKCLPVYGRLSRFHQYLIGL